MLIVYWSIQATAIPQTSKNLTLDLTVTQYSEQQQDRPDIPEPSGKTEYVIGDEVYFDPVKGQRCYSDEAWTLDDKSRTCYKCVIKTSNSSSDTVELLLDHDLPGDVEWISLEDYKAAGGTEEEYSDGCYYEGVNGEQLPCGNDKYGPLTALKHLKQGTDSWNGVVTLTSADNVTRDNGSGGTYIINYEGYKARLISGQEVADIVGEPDWTPDGNTIWELPTWLYSNMAISTDMSDMSDIDIYEHAAYWTDSAYAWDPGHAWSMRYDGTLFNYDLVSRAYGYGVRPVVKILKSNL